MTILLETAYHGANGTYGSANAYIGDIKALLVQDPNVEILSDINPADPEVSRILTYIVNSSKNGHAMQMQGGSSGNITFGLLNMAGLASLQNTTGMSINFASNFALVFNASMHFLFAATTNVASMMITPFVAFDTGDPSGWYTGNWSADQNKIYKASSDSIAYTVINPYHTALCNGQFVLLPMRFLDTGNIMPYYNANLFGIGPNLYSEGIYKNSLGQEYYVHTSLAKYMLVRDASN